jgi:glutamate-1-semialdehyde 2,1-aminomutase
MLEEVVRKTHVVTFNNLNAVERKVRERKGKIAAIIVEPILHNIGCVMPKTDFLKGLREITEQHGIVLIFDEIITGFRHSLGGYQKICGVTPDLTTLGKSIANGYPLSAICGREDFMNRFKTAGGDVFFGGTYNDHPLSVAASIATLEELEKGSVYERIFALGDQMRKGMQEICESFGLRAYATGFGSVFVTYFMEPPVENYTDLLRNDAKIDEAYRRAMIERGFLIMPDSLTRGVISASHTEEDVRNTLDASKSVLEGIMSSSSITNIH